MIATDHNLRILEDRFERLSFQFTALMAQVQALATQLAGLQSNAGGGNSVGSSTVWSVPAQVIGTGSSVSGQTVSTLIAGSLTTVTTTGVVWNHSGAATSATAGEIYVGLNADSTYRVIAQACS